MRAVTEPREQGGDRDRSRSAASADASSPSQLGWRRYVPEAIGLVLLLVCIDEWVFDGTRYAWLTPRPLWIPTILISAQYGLVGGVFAAIAATLALYSSALPSQLVTQDYYAYSRQIVAEPTAWLACALILGGLRSLHIFHAAELRQQRDDALAEAGAVGQGLTDALAEIARLELRIAGEMRTIGAVGRAFGSLDTRDRAVVAATVADIACIVVGASAVTVYGTTTGGLVVLARSGGDPAYRPDAEPPPSAELAAALSRTPERLWRRDCDGDAGLLPNGALMAVGLASPDRSGAEGLLVVERLLPRQDVCVAAVHACEIGRGLGALLASVRP